MADSDLLLLVKSHARRRWVFSSNPSSGGGGRCRCNRSDRRSQSSRPVGAERTKIGYRDNPRLRAPLSAAERGHFSCVGKCPHPLLGHGPLKLRVGGFVGRSSQTMDVLAELTTSSDHATSWSRRTIETSTVKPSRVTLRDKGESTIFGSCSIIVASVST